MGKGRAIGLGDYLSAVLFNGLGRYHDALASAERACEHEDLGVFGFPLVELVEAAARADAPGSAAAALRRLEERTTASGAEWALGILARSRALLSDGPAAESHMADGFPVPLLLAASRRAGLVVVGDRALGGFTFLLVGSFAIGLAAGR